MISKKIIITGSFAVGKTSLFMRFIQNTFSEKYLTTIGVKVDKKVVKVGDREISLILWDIAGEVSQEKVPKTYFLGTSAIIYVFDLTRPLTGKNMKADLAYLEKLIPGCITRIVGNKKDLLSEADLISVQKQIKPDYLTSAKTGENVEALFYSIGEELLAKTTF